MHDQEIVVQVTAVHPGRGTVAVLDAVTAEGLPVLVAAEPRMAADIAAELAGGGTVFTAVAQWGVFGGSSRDTLLAAMREDAHSGHYFG